jgi:hypothetical protein
MLPVCYGIARNSLFFAAEFKHRGTDATEKHGEKPRGMNVKKRRVIEAELHGQARSQAGAWERGQQELGDLRAFSRGERFS